MNENNHKLDSIPDDFSSIEGAAEFWDTHNLADYWDEIKEAEIAVRAPHRQWVPLANSLREVVAERAR